MRLKGKTALITGGTKGIGKAIALKFIEEGAEVIVFDLKIPDYKCQFFRVDVSDERKIKRAFSRIKKIDILVNNAGIYFQADVTNTNKKDLDKLIDTDLKGPYLMCKFAIPLLAKTKGNIINIASGLGIHAEPESPAYCASKAGLIMLTKCLALRYAKNIRVNAILPGPIDTPLLRECFSSQKDLEEYAKLNPMGRIGLPIDVANIALFLASNEANYVTGGLYSVDGGESIN